MNNKDISKLIDLAIDHKNRHFKKGDSIQKLIDMGFDKIEVSNVFGYLYKTSKNKEEILKTILEGGNYWREESDRIKRREEVSKNHDEKLSDKTIKFFGLFIVLLFLIIIIVSFILPTEEKSTEDLDSETFKKYKEVYDRGYLEQDYKDQFDGLPY